MDLNWRQIVGLFILAIPIACVTRTAVYEEIFREPRDFCIRKSKTCRGVVARKFFYALTCEYCFSHWVTLIFMAITGYRLMFVGFRGYLIGFFALVLIANFYLNIYSRLRLEITSEKKHIEVTEKEIEKIQTEMGTGQVEARGRGDGQ